MTEYNYFPPIRFQFEGDTKAAQKRIPQARALMQQLIRRMETTELDALNWRVSSADGYFFEIHKYGDQHIALIRAPEREVVIEDERDSKGDYLWIGARLVLPEYSEGLYNLNYVPEGSLSTITKWRETPGETGVWERLPPYYIPSQRIDWRYSGYAEVPSGGTNSIELKGYISEVPKPNLVLFAPDARLRESGSVFQTYHYTGYGPVENAVPSTLLFQSIVPVNWTNPNDGYVWWNRQSTEFNERGWVIDEAETKVIDQPFLLYTWSARKIYSSTLIYKKDNPISVQTYLCLDASDQSKVVSDFYEPYTLSGALLEWGAKKVREGADVTFSVDGDPSAEYGTATKDVRYRELIDITYTDGFIEKNESSLIQATKDDIKDGLYELRLSGGWENPKTPYPDVSSGQDISLWNDAECEVFIQVGTNLQSYTVRLNATNNFERTTTFLGDDNIDDESWADPGTRGGVFNIAGWIEDGMPTPMNDTWYPGCWLIDIKKQTIIHETRPDRLERPWFS